MVDDPQASRRPTLAVATVGHHRHGKTTLTAALTHVLQRRGERDVAAVGVAELDRRSGCLPLDRFPRLIARNADGDVESLTIRGSQIRYGTERRAFVHLDCPGRRPWLKNAVRCQSLADALILVVSAPDSVQPQTREHLLVARALGLRQIVVFITKCDVVADLEWLDLVEQDTRELLVSCGFDGDAAPIIRGAALPALRGEPAWEASIHALVEALTVDVEIANFSAEGAPLIHLHQVFSRRPPGGGVIVEGRLRRGTLQRGQLLGLVGIHERRQVNLADIEVFRRKVERVEAGEFAGLLLRREDLRRTQVASGQALVEGLGAGVRRLSVAVELFAPAEGGRTTPIADGHTPLALFGAAAVGTTLRLDRGRRLHPGEATEAVLELRAPVHVEPGMSFLLRDGWQGPGWTQGVEPTWGGSVGLGRVLAVE